MKRIILTLVVLIALVLGLTYTVSGMGGGSPEKTGVVDEYNEYPGSETPAATEPAPAAVAPTISSGSSHIISDFESGSLKSPQEWWTFDIKTAAVVPNTAYTGGDSEVAENVGRYSLQLKGDAANWYVGGVGTYVAKEGQDLSKYDTLIVDIYGNGESSGTLKIELLDDDNGNWQIEQDPKKAYAPTSDDKLTTEILVDWQGWQRLAIPLADFVDANPGVGDDIWNPNQAGDSGGLLQIQLVCIAPAQVGKVNFNVDNITLTKE
ncbi:MAG: hypothetical protein JW782_07865 [Candidatus Saganbacteria bacterium]|nr:hypothetical protein [Candidatus Saganbacteria bacterium]